MSHGVGVRGVHGGVGGGGRGDGDDGRGRGASLTSPPLERVLLKARVGDAPAQHGVAQCLAHGPGARVVVQLLQHREVASLHLPGEKQLVVSSDRFG